MFGKSLRGTCDDIAPLSGNALTQESDARVPGAVRPFDEPVPVKPAVAWQKHGGRDAEGASEMCRGVADRDDLVHRRFRTFPFHAYQLVGFRMSRVLLRWHVCGTIQLDNG